MTTDQTAQTPGTPQPPDGDQQNPAGRRGAAAFGRLVRTRAYDEPASRPTTGLERGSAS